MSGGAVNGQKSISQSENRTYRNCAEVIMNFNWIWNWIALLYCKVKRSSSSSSFLSQHSHSHPPPFPKSKSHRYLCAIFIYWKLCRVPFNLLHWSARPLLDGSNKYVSTLSSQTTLTIIIIIIYHWSSSLSLDYHCTTSHPATITNSSDLLKLYLVMKNMPSPFRLIWVRQGQ